MDPYSLIQKDFFLKKSNLSLNTSSIQPHGAKCDLNYVFICFTALHTDKNNPILLLSNR